MYNYIINIINNMTTKMNLLSMILNVISDGDTSSDILNKINNEFPEYIERKIKQKGTKEAGLIQARAEISSNIGREEGIWFNINKNVKPYTYFEICNEIDDRNDITEITDYTEDHDVGYVYIIDNHLSYKNKQIYKIGKANDIDKRIDQLNREQSSYEPHTIIRSFKVKNPYKVEHAIHCALDNGRINPKKEAFYANYVNKHIDLIEQIVKLFDCE